MTENRFRPPPLVALPDPERRLLELEFLHEFAQLAAQARDWDELMRTIIERTTVALRVDVCSLYLMDRDGDRLTLAATNGLDPNHVGKVSLALGEGITGNAAKRREPIQVPDVRLDPRFKWVRGYDLQGITSMLSVPLTWNDRVVGVINTQTRASRNFAAEEIEFLVTIAALLGGIVEKGRLQTERERQARIILGTAETDIAAKFAEASKVYINNPVALHLRAMNMLYEAIKEKGSMVIVPSSAVETMGLGGLLGTASLGGSKPQ